MRLGTRFQSFGGGEDYYGKDLCKDSCFIFHRKNPAYNNDRFSLNCSFKHTVLQLFYRHAGIILTLLLWHR